MHVRIIGCGLSGATAARILTDQGHACTIHETRNHIGGNCYDSMVNGVRLHHYGPHIFHTDDEEVYQFLSRFTEWVNFKLQPKGRTRLGVISLPYSRKTVKELKRELSQLEIVEYIFREYSEKQWGVGMDEIPATIINRIPKTKDCDDPTWFEGQKYQCIPLNGYTAMIEKMLEGVTVKLSCPPDDWRLDLADLTIYTGKIDEYFGYRYGRLPYRSLIFNHSISTEKMPYFILNENNDEVANTRQYDHSYLTPGHKGDTIITKEYPTVCGPKDIPFYPIPFGAGLKLYARYKGLADKQQNVIFIGRLATYTYLDMWMAVKQTMLKIRNVPAAVI